MSRDDQIQLELPASPEYGRVARIAAAHLALRLGFTLTEIDDLRLVMDEAAVMLLEPGLDAERFNITYSLSDDTVCVDAQVVSASTAPLPTERIKRFGDLVGDLMDTYSVDASQRRLTLEKSRAGSKEESATGVAETA